MGKKRGQISIELVLTVGFALVMIIPLTILLYEHNTNTQRDINGNQAHLIARKITDVADSVYYMGYPSTQTIKVYMPRQIDSINITDREITMFLDDGNEIVSSSKINLSGTVSPSSGLRLIQISAEEDYVKIEDVN